MTQVQGKDASLTVTNGDADYEEDDEAAIVAGVSSFIIIWILVIAFQKIITDHLQILFFSGRDGG